MKKHQNPAEWNTNQLKDNWLYWVEELSEETGHVVPAKRIILQTEGDPEAMFIFQSWQNMRPEERVKSWKKLLSITQREAENPLPACVQCGECCRRGSPTLYMEDLELLKTEKIPWNQLVTLRRGEPVRHPASGKTFFLVDERIKLREKPGTNTCVFLNETSDVCTCIIYENRPLQCRAQACWDLTAYEQLKDQVYLTRRDIFAEVDVLLDIIIEHDKRCGFEKLHFLFQQLERNRDVANQILDLVAYESHFRNFVGQQLNIPEEIYDLVFGRSFETLISLFGCKIKISGDTRYLEVIGTVEEDPKKR